MQARNRNVLRGHIIGIVIIWHYDNPPPRPCQCTCMQLHLLRVLIHNYTQYTSLIHPLHTEHIIYMLITPPYVCTHTCHDMTDTGPDNKHHHSYNLPLLMKIRTVKIPWWIGAMPLYMRWQKGAMHCTINILHALYTKWHGTYRPW